jgi:NAD(P)-dependent dehydrogenase (short-subunit alcohol dehydrogenase family)
MADRPQAGEVALVTGATRGIGREIAAQLADRGMRVYAAGRDRRRGGELERALHEYDVRFVELDVTMQSQVDAAVERIDQESGRLDVLVNNAGVVVEWGVPPAAVSAHHMRTALEVNVIGAVAVTHACLPLLRRAPGARIVNLSSPLGSMTLLTDPAHPAASRGLLAYSSSKAALNAVTVLYAHALRDEGIAVNAVNPGLVPTDLNAGSPHGRGSRSARDAAVVVVQLAMVGPGGPSGAFRGGMLDGTVHDDVPW